jgi:hypothetical protein
MGRLMPLVCTCALVSAAGCTSPDVSAEVGTFSKAVTEVSASYRQSLGIGPATIREGQIAALVGDRTSSLGLATDCLSEGTGDDQVSISSCVLDDGGITLGEHTLARAETQLILLADYFAAIDALAKSTSPVDVENAASAAIASVGALDAALPGTGLGAFAATLKERRTGISKVSGFLTDQYRYGKLRRIVADADPAVSRIVLALRDAAEANGVEPTRAAYERLNEARGRMDALQLGGSDAEYAAAVRGFMAEYDAFVAYRKTGLLPRLELIAETHAALRDRLTGPATTGEIIALIDRLNAIDVAFQ